MTLEELEAEAMKLDLPSRTELARRLTASLAAAGQAPSPPSSPPTPPPPTDEERERLWLQDAMRRSRELRERQVQTEPPDSQAVFRPPRPAREERGEARRRRPARQRKTKPVRAQRAKPAPRPSRARRSAKRPKPLKSRPKPRSPRR